MRASAKAQVRIAEAARDEAIAQRDQAREAAADNQARWVTALANYDEAIRNLREGIDGLGDKVGALDKNVGRLAKAVAADPAVPGAEKPAKRAPVRPASTKATRKRTR